MTSSTKTQGFLGSRVYIESCRVTVINSCLGRVACPCNTGNVGVCVIINIALPYSEDSHSPYPFWLKLPVLKRLLSLPTWYGSTNMGRIGHILLQIALGSADCEEAGKNAGAGWPAAEGAADGECIAKELSAAATASENIAATAMDEDRGKNQKAPKNERT